MCSLWEVWEVINMPSASWSILPSTSLRLLERSNSELYLTFRGEGPGSELTSTKATRSRKLAEERPGPGWWVFVVETARFLKQKFVGLCALQLGSPGGLWDASTGHPWIPSTNTSLSPWFTICFFLHMSSDSANRDRVGLNEGRKGEEAVPTKWSELWKKKKINHTQA